MLGRYNVFTGECTEQPENVVASKHMSVHSEQLLRLSVSNLTFSCLLCSVSKSPDWAFGGENLYVPVSSLGVPSACDLK